MLNIDEKLQNSTGNVLVPLYQLALCCMYGKLRHAMTITSISRTA